VVAVWSHSGTPTASSDPLTGPLSCGDGDAPRGIRTPNRQIRSQPSPVPARPPRPFASLPVLVNGHVAGSGRTLIPARHVRLGRNVVANSRHGRQTRSLAMRFVDRLCCGRSTRFLICCSGTGGFICLARFLRHWIAFAASILATASGGDGNPRALYIDRT
jgi:hypothetical protein